jgi:hypothetical protein
MQNLQLNPLQKHFRQPAIYIKLPSDGAHWPDGSIDLPLNGELPVYPMTARDEITLKTPDALLNGQGVVNVIQSCIPNIKNAWAAPSVDIDKLLISIRIASYGNAMEVSSSCTHCSEENKHELDLSFLIDTMKIPDFNKLVMVNGLRIKLKPQSYFEANKQNMISFEQEQILKVINDPNFDEQRKVVEYQKHMDKLVELNFEMFTNLTESITTNEGYTVVEPAFIMEYYQNTDTKVISALRERIDQLAIEGNIKPVNVRCESCDQEYNVVVGFDYANFFA